MHVVRYASHSVSGPLQSEVNLMLVQSRGQMNMSVVVNDISMVTTRYRSLGYQKTIKDGRSKVRRSQPFGARVAVFLSPPSLPLLPSLPQVLSLTSPITATYLTLPLNKGAMIDATVPSVFLTLSPATIRLVLHVMQALTPEKVCVCVCVCARACVRVCVCVCTRVRVCMHHINTQTPVVIETSKFTYAYTWFMHLTNSKVCEK